MTIRTAAINACSSPRTRADKKSSGSIALRSAHRMLRHPAESAQAWTVKDITSPTTLRERWLGEMRFAVLDDFSLYRHAVHPGPPPTTRCQRSPPAVRRHPGHPEAPGHLTVTNPGLDQVSGHEPRP
ncbi:hypothetical protein SSPO_078850 [Streptomyces antimycoticus]|uniref:Uncharacterized protein n=1 Tax=Streptomyces antimycoticus TaxID=68175 RepID=A0A499VG79_9ACTN|nr:hypothetical protein SSPO_078850 [Streptomyces antimycoticus]